jgi:hypothetical protein
MNKKLLAISAIIALSTGTLALGVTPAMSDAAVPSTGPILVSSAAPSVSSLPLDSMGEPPRLAHVRTHFADLEKIVQKARGEE